MKRRFVFAITVLIVIMTCLTLVSCDGASTVTLYTDGGSSDGAQVATDSIANVVPEKTGYTFCGWFADSAKTVPVNVSDADFAGSISQTGALYASWTPVEFSITYDLAGGAFVEPTTDSYNVLSSDITLSVPQKDGYTFLGWFDSGEYFGNAIESIPSGSIGNKHFYAAWSPFNVTYVLGAADVQNPDAVIAYDGSADITLPVPTRLGYEFQGWYDNANYSYDAYTKIFRGEKGNKIFYAKWTQCVYTVTYVLNGGENAVGNVTRYTVGISCSFADATRYGYDFLGWHEDPTGGDASVTGYPMGTVGDKTLHALWTPTIYTIGFYNIDGATHSNALSYSIESPAITLTAANKSGYTFLNWYDANNRVVTSIPAGSTGDRSYQANWAAIRYDIRYLDSEQPTLMVSTSNRAFYTAEDLFTLQPLNVGSDYEFVGWYTTPECDGTPVTVIPIAGQPCDHLWLYAKSLRVLNVNYHLSSDAVNNPLNVNTFTVETETFSLHSATRNGYEFSEWNTMPDGSGTTVTQVTKGRTSLVDVYPIWSLIDYEIRYVEDIVEGEEVFGTPVTDYNIESVLHLYTPEKDGYDFSGWCESPDFTDTPFTVLVRSYGDKKFYAKWTPAEYTVTYHLGEDASNNVNNRSAFSLLDTFDFLNPSRIGYRFKGWYTEDTFTNKVNGIENGLLVYEGSGTATTYGPVTLYAKYLELFSIQYNTSGTTGNNPTQYAIEDEFVFAESTYAGSKFYGWFRDPSYSERMLGIGGGMTGNIVLYARFSELHAINYIMNEGVNSADNPSEYTVLDTIVFETPQKNGAEFLGWYDSNGTKIESVSNSTAELTLTATWQYFQYDVTYVLNGGSLSDESRVNKYTVAARTVDVDAEMVPEKDNYVFRGWYLDAEFTQKIDFLPLLENPRNISLHAKFFPLTDIHNVVYLNTKNSPNQNADEYYQGESCALLNIAKLGYSFDKWTITGTDTVVTDFIQCTGDVSLTANWIADTHSITYNMNEGQNNPSNPSSFTTDESVTFLAPTREHYDFAGWYTDSSYTATVEGIAQGTTENRSITAKWQLHVYSALLVLDDGYTTTQEFTIESYFDTENAECHKMPLPDASMDGMTFVSWHTDSGCTSAAKKSITWPLKGTVQNDEYNVADTVSALSGITLYAKWSPTVYRVTYMLDGGTNNPLNPADYTVADSVSLRAATKNGYIFVGWYEIDVKDMELVTLVTNRIFSVGYVDPVPSPITESNYITTMVQLNENNAVNAITAGNGGNRVFYAKWTSTTHSVTFHTDASTVVRTFTKDDVVELWTPESPAGDEVFYGWYRTDNWDDPDLDEKLVTVFDCTAETSNVDLYARFVTCYVIDYELNGGSYPNMVTQYTLYDDNSELGIPSKDGFMFIEWYVVDQADQSIEVVTELNPAITRYETISGGIRTIKIWAKFLQRYIVTYSLDGGENNIDNPVNFGVETVIYNDNPVNLYYVQDPDDPKEYVIYSDAIPLNAPTRAGYDFDNWYDISKDSNAFESNKQSHIKTQIDINRSITLYAVFLKSIPVTYILDGGTNAPENPDTFNQNDSIELQPATKSGYDFLYWANTLGARVTHLDATQTQSPRFTAVWTPTEYTIEYNFNGGSEHSDNPETYTVESEDIVLVHTLKGNYDFLGWEDGNGNIVSIIPKGSKGNLSLTAKFVLTEYRVTYVLGYDEAEMPIDTLYSFTLGGSIIELKEPTLDGADFLGWYNTPNYTGSIVASLNTANGGNRTYYAKWELYDYDVVYVLNGGVNDDKNIDSCDISTSFTLFEPTKANSAFLGWYRTFAAGSYSDPITKIESVYPHIIAYDNPEDGNGYLTLYARFETRRVIRYHLDSAAGESNNVGNLSYITVSSPVMPLLTPTKTYYDFLGWFGNSDLTDPITEISVSTPYMTDGSQSVINVYAKWTPTVYTIGYELNGGIDTGLPRSYTVELAANIDLQAYIPTKAGYTFEGFYNEATFQTRVSYIFKNQGDTVTSFGNRFLYVKWSLTPLTITYQGMENATQNIAFLESFTVESMNINLSLYVPEKLGYTFKEWKNGLGHVVTSIPTGTTQSVTLTAQWKLTIYNINYVLGGDGVDNSANTSRTTYSIENSVALYNPSRQFYEFGGWFTDTNFVEGTNVLNVSGTGNVSLYAHWIPISYNVIYNITDGSNNLFNPLVYTADDRVVLRKASRAGYNFIGWYTGANASGEKVTELGFGEGGDVTVYAYFSKAYAINYVMNGGVNNQLNPASYTELDEITLADPVAANGYLFTGWYLLSNLSGQRITVIESGTKVDGLTLYAGFVPICFVSYELDGGTNDARNKTYYIEGEVTQLYAPTKNAFLFLGWYENSRFTGQPITEISELYNTDITLYARWGQWQGYIDFGRYPQSLLEDDAIIDALDTHAGTENASTGYIEYNGAEYLFADGSYYIVEPIRWQILAYSDGKVTLISELGLDAMAMNSALPNGYEYDWDASELKNALDSFGEGVFTSTEQSALVTLQRAISTNSKYGSTSGDSAVNSLVSIFSAEEATSAEYGYAAAGVVDDSRIAAPSDFAARNADTDVYGNCYWWLYTPGANAEYAAYVGADGKVYENGANVSLTGICIRPVIVVDLLQG